MRRTEEDLRRTLSRIDGRGYPAYRDLRGSWSLPQFTLEVRHVQGDPFAAPSRVAVILQPDRAAFDPAILCNASRRTALSCLLARKFALRARATRARRTGSGRSGEVTMLDPGQVVLPNTAVLIDPDGTVEARFTIGLPAAGRRILGRQAATLLLESLPALVARTLVASAHSPVQLNRHAEVNEDADHMRSQLGKLGLVAFIANDSLLPRRSGIDDRPLLDNRAILFNSPPRLEVTLERLNSPPVVGMGIPRGVTLLVGGGYHGKSTVLDAVAQGVYNHRPGDGREWVVTDPTATKIQAEDGRSVAGVDISPFIGTLPAGQDTTCFTTTNASGSTSQAAGIIEALEARSRLLLIDEDTSATNFMIRDRRMQALVQEEDEPITPFIDRVQSLYRDAGASTLLVIGGSGDYLDVADLVLGMVRYQPHDLTEEARSVAGAHPTGRIVRDAAATWPWRHRCPDPRSIRPWRGRKQHHVKVPSRSVIEFGNDRIDLTGVRQIALRAQARAIALALAHMQQFMGAGMAVEDTLDAMRNLLDSEGLDALEPARTGDLAMPRIQEIAATLARLRTLTLTGAQP